MTLCWQCSFFPPLFACFSILFCSWTETCCPWFGVSNLSSFFHHRGNSQLLFTAWHGADFEFLWKLFPSAIPPWASWQWQNQICSLLVICTKWSSSNWNYRIWRSKSQQPCGSGNAGEGLYWHPRSEWFGMGTWTGASCWSTLTSDIPFVLRVIRFRPCWVKTREAGKCQCGNLLGDRELCWEGNVMFVSFSSLIWPWEVRARGWGFCSWWFSFPDYCSWQTGVSADLLWNMAMRFLSIKVLSSTDLQNSIFYSTWSLELEFSFPLHAVPV